MQTTRWFNVSVGLAIFFITGCVRDPVLLNTNVAPLNQSNNTSNYAVVKPDSDFIPPLGSPQNPPPESAGERRLLLARSSDGLQFTADGTILTDQGNVPDAVVDANGRIYLYYIGQSIDPNKPESTVVALSDDHGVSWSFRTLQLNDWPQPRDPSDPDVVILPDGSFRMFYTTSLANGRLGIAYADSPDGISFTYQAEALSSPTGNVIDSTTFQWNDRWYMYVLNDRQPNQLLATSLDGKTFTLGEDPVLTLPLPHYIVSNPLMTDEAVRLFGFSLSSADIRSFTSSDMTNWQADAVALSGDAVATYNTSYIQDSTVVPLADGSYVMIYVSALNINP